MRVRVHSYIVAGFVALVLVTPLLLSYPILGVALGAVSIVLWWLLTLDWWRRFYVLTLIFAIGATSNIEPFTAVGLYGRFPAVALLLLATAAAYGKAATRTLNKVQKRVLAALWFIVVLAGLSTLWSVVPGETLIQAAALGAFVCILQLLMRSRWANRETMVADFKAGYIVLLGSLIASVGAAVAGFPDAVSADRLQGIYGNPNIAAQMAVFALFLGIGLYRGRSPLLHLTLAAPSVAVLLLAESRTALVAGAVAAVWVIARSSAQTILRVLHTAAVTTCLVLLVGLQPFSAVFDRFGSTAGGDVLGGRLDAWGPAIRLIAEQPFGYGWAASGTLFESMFGFVWFTFNNASVHSSYLQYLVELGLPGVAPLLYLLLVFVLIAVRGTMSGAGVGLIGVVVAGVAIQVAESSMFGMGQPYPYIFWFAVAAALTLYEPTQPKELRVGKRPLHRDTATLH